MRNCATCHGHRPDPKAAWDVKTGAKWIHKITRLVMPQPGDKYDPPPYAIGTDPERVLFRYADILPTALWARFPGSPIPLAAEEKIPACSTFEKTLPGRLYDAQGAAGGARRIGRTRAIQGRFRAGELLDGPARARVETARRMWPAGHPLSFGPSEICYDVHDLGYFNNPIPFALSAGALPAQRLGADHAPTPQSRRAHEDVLPRRQRLRSAGDGHRNPTRPAQGGNAGPTCRSRSMRA